MQSLSAPIPEEFKRHLDEAGVTLGERPDTRTHADDDIQTPPEDFPQHASVYNGLRANRVPWWDDHRLWAADESERRDEWIARCRYQCNFRRARKQLRSGYLARVD
jgi:hypothetical protein